MDRLEIKGKYATAIAYAKVIEDEAVEQIRRMCDYEFTAGAQIRIMPDVHWGKGCTIGTTMTVADKVVPNLVGVDIGCGMYTVDLGKGELDLAKVDEAAHIVPSGRGLWKGRQAKFDFLALRCYRALNDTKRIGRSLGTLGGGNHFIEIDRAADGTHYLVIHTGSRNLDKQVAEYYQKIAGDLAHGKEALFDARDEMIRRYKAEGRRAELQEALKELNRNFRPTPRRFPRISAMSTASIWTTTCTTSPSVRTLRKRTARRSPKSSSTTSASRPATRSTPYTTTSTPRR